MNIPRPFSADDDTFDAYDEFVPEHVPGPGPFLEDHDVLTGREHAAFHRLARERFEERGVYDVTFGYNLARLNLDVRHRDAGFRYARDAEDPAVLRAEFTPTTEFCPQSETLTVGAFRAWNGDPERHEYDRVRGRVDPMHHEAAAINAKLADLDEHLAETGEPTLPDDSDDGPDVTDPTDDAVPF